MSALIPKDKRPKLKNEAPMINVVGVASRVLVEIRRHHCEAVGTQFAFPLLKIPVSIVNALILSPLRLRGQAERQC